MFDRKISYIFFVSLMALVGCQKSDDQTKFQPQTPSEFEATLSENESLYKQAMSAIKDSNWYCDQSLKPQITEITRFLDSKREIINGLANSLKPTDPNQTLKFGDFNLILSDPPSDKPESRWDYDAHGWLSLYNTYLHTKDAEPGVHLLRMVRTAKFLISDDTGRSSNWNYSLSHSDGPNLKSVSDALKACLDQADCIAPSLQNQKDFLNRQATYQYYLRQLASETNSKEEKRKTLEKFWARTSNEYRNYFEHRQQSFIQRQGANLTVKIDSGFLSEQAEKLANLIQNIWSSKELRVNLKWEAQAQFPDIFKFTQGLGLGGRANVNFAKRSITLFNYGNTNTLYHEFGHVLGLNDQYFTRYDYDNCMYIVESDSSNIMSNSSSGFVSDEVWKQLDKLYPLN